MAIKYNVGLLGFDWDNNLIEVQNPQNTVNIQDLINAIREAEASEIGMNYKEIATASGKEELDSGVYVGITINLVNWQIRFWSGNYIAKIAGGNLVGGLSGDPVAYSAGVQVLLVQSAASTVVTVSTGSGLSAEQAAQLANIDTHTTAIPSDVWGTDNAQKLLNETLHKAVIAPDDLSVTIYEEDGTTVSHQYDISLDKRTRTPV